MDEHKLCALVIVTLALKLRRFEVTRLPICQGRAWARMSTSSELENLTREQLIARIRELEGQRAVGGGASDDLEVADAVRGTRREPINKRARLDAKAQRAIDFSRYRRKYVAFKFAYLGWHYNGLVQQSSPTELPTVEEEIFRALLKCRLIQHPERCRFSRCGRTDKGVSAMGQVMALEIRSSQLLDSDPGQASCGREPPWLEQLNGLLPESIRIYAYDDTIAQDFDARFSCQSRHYRYLMAPRPAGTGRSLDTDAMQTACNYLVGDHDFRNLCKLDASKQITNFRRTISRCSVAPLVRQAGFADAADPAERFAAPDHGLLVLDLEGSAFLWHQVRCISAILLLIGQGLEPPTLMRDLLDVEKVPTKPVYEMADAWPLTLYDCDFGDAVRWKYAERSRPGTTPRVLESAFATMHAARIKDTISTFLNTVVAGPVSQDVAGVAAEADARDAASTSTGSPGINVGDGRIKHIRSYTPVLQRQRLKDVSITNAHYAARQASKGKLLPRERFLQSQASTAERDMDIDLE